MLRNIARHRIDRGLDEHGDVRGIAHQCVGRHDGQIAARAVARQDESGECAIQLRRRGCDPARRRFAIVGRGGEGVFGREPVIDRDDRQIEPMRDFGAKRIVDFVSRIASADGRASPT